MNMINRFQTKISMLFALILSGVFSYFLLNQSGPSGVNGYFYLKQIQFFYQTHQLYFQDRSLSFALPFLVRHLGATDLQAFAISLSLVLCVFLWVQIKTIEILTLRTSLKPKSVTILGVLLCCYLMTNPHFLFFAMNFYKNLTALLFISSGLLFLLRSEISRKLNLIIAFVLFVLALFCHKSSAVYCLLLMLFYFIQHFRYRFSKKLVSVLILMSAFIVFVFIFYFSQSKNYMGYLLGSLQLSTDFVPWLAEQARLGNFIFCSYLIILISCGFCIYYWRTLVRQENNIYLLFFVFIGLISLLPFHAQGQNQIGYRWILANVALSAPFLSLLSTKSKTLGGTLLGLHLCQFVFAAPIHKYFLPYQESESAFLKIKEHVNANDYLISHHGLEFYVDYITGIRARIFLPEPEEVHGQVYRIVYVPFNALRWQPLREKVVRDSLLRINLTYFLMREEQWQSIQREVINSPKTWHNPYQKNPGHVYH